MKFGPYTRNAIVVLREAGLESRAKSATTAASDTVDRIKAPAECLAQSASFTSRFKPKTWWYQLAATSRFLTSI